MLEDLAVDGTVIITRILKNYICSLYKYHVLQNKFRLWGFVNMVMNLQVP